jgi:hypothetical protein
VAADVASGATRGARGEQCGAVLQGGLRAIRFDGAMTIVDESIERVVDVRRALATFVRGAGPEVLDRPDELTERLRSALPDRTREIQLLELAARFSLGARIAARDTDDTDPATGVEEAAAWLSERSGVDPSSSRWVATEIAVALGGRPAQLSASTPSSVPIVDAETVDREGPTRVETAHSIEGNRGRGPTAISVARARRLRRIVLGLVITLIGYSVAAHAERLVPFGSDQASSNHSPHRPAPALPVSHLLPSDLNPSADCHEIASTAQANGLGMGLVTAETCGEFNLDHGSVLALQYASSADYQAALRTLDHEDAFDPAAAAKDCPPAGSGQGLLLSFTSYREVIECFTLTVSGSSEHAFVWTYPPPNVIIMTLTTSDWATFDDWLQTEGIPSRT